MCYGLGFLAVGLYVVFGGAVLGCRVDNKTGRRGFFKKKFRGGRMSVGLR